MFRCRPDEIKYGLVYQFGRIQKSKISGEERCDVTRGHGTARRSPAPARPRRARDAKPFGHPRTQLQPCAHARLLSDACLQVNTRRVFLPWPWVERAALGVARAVVLGSGSVFHKQFPMCYLGA